MIQFFFSIPDFPIDRISCSDSQHPFLISDFPINFFFLISDFPDKSEKKKTDCFLVMLLIRWTLCRWYRLEEYDSPEQRGQTRDRRFHRDPRHVWFRGSKAQPTGASLYKSVRRDDAALLQHSHIQEFDRKLQGRRYSMRR